MSPVCGLFTLLFAATAIAAFLSYQRDKAFDEPLRIIARHCIIVFMIGLAASIDLATILFRYSPWVFTSDSTPSAIEPDPVPAESQPVELPIIDYAEILRNSKEYDGQEVLVAGRIAKLGYDSNKHTFYFSDRLGSLETGKFFDVTLSRHFFSLSEGVSDYYVVNQYVLVRGVWHHGGSYSELRNAEVISTGDDARQADQVFMDEWEAVGRSYANFPITDYMELFSHPKSYLGQRIRTVGQIQSSGNNVFTGAKSFSFRDRRNGRITESFSLLGCPPEMQDACVEGEYAVISCLVAQDKYGSIWFAACFVECTGDEAEALSKQADSEWWEQSADDRDEYIAACQQYAYDDLIRYPNDYKGKQIALQGTVVRVSEDLLHDTFLVNIGQDQYISVDYYGKLLNDPEILRDDQIIFYGECKGNTLYYDAQDEAMTVPLIRADYSSFNQFDW